MAEVTLVIKARNEAQAALNAVKGDLQSLAQAAQGVGGQLKQAGKALTGAGVGISAGITAPVTAIGTAALLSAADFEQAMNVMQQVSGATEGQMASLQAQALQLGAETSFSAGEVAQAMLELSKAGLSAAEVSAAIGGTLDLAAAGGLGLAQAAEISANAVNVFGLSADQTTRVANMLAAAANASSVEVTDLAQGMQMAGAVFAASGQSADTLTTALALMGNAGIKGSDAGTSLKTMLMSLTAPTETAAKQLQALGVSVYDAEGNMRALPDVMNDLRSALYGTHAVTVTSSNLTAEQAERMKYLQKTIESTQRKLADYQAGIAGVAQSENDKVVAVDRLNRVLAAAQAEYASLASIGSTTSTVMRTLTEEQRNAALTAIFGSDAIRAANILLKEGATGWQEMAAALGNETAAADVANARMKGISGAIEYVKGSIDSFLIGTMLPFADSISGALRAVGDMVTAFGQLPEPVKNAALGFTLAAAAIGPLLIGLGMATSAVGAALPVLAALAGPVGLIIAAVVALGVAWATNFMGIRAVTMPVVNAITLAFQRAQMAVLAFGGSQTWGRVTATVAKSFAAIGAALAGAFGGDISLPDLAGKISAELGKVATAVGGALASADFAAMKDGIVKALGMDGVSLAGMQASLAALPGKVTDALAAIDWVGAFATASEKATALKDGVSGWVTGAIGGVDWAGLGATLTAMRDSAIGAITSVDWVGGFNAAVGAVNGVRDSVLGWLAGAIGGIPWPTLSLDFAGFISTIANKLKTIDWSSINPMSLFMPLVERLVPGLGQAIGAVNWVVSSEQFGELVTAVVGAITAIDWGAVGTALLGLVESTKQALLGLNWGALSDAAEPIRAAVQGLFDGMQLNITLPTLDTTALTASITQVQETLAPAFERLTGALAGLPGGLAQLQPSLAGLAGAFGSLWNSLQPVILALGVTLVVAASAGTNFIAAAISRLPGIVGPMIDQVTASINMIATTISGVTEAIAAIAVGDWAGAWGSLKSIVTGFEEFLGTTWTNVTTMLGNVGGAIGEAVTNTLNDLGLTAAAETVQTIIAAIGQLKADIESLSVSDVLQPLLNWKWPEFPTIPDVVSSLISFKWPDFPALPSILDSLVAWKWPGFPSMPSWLDRLLSWSWPTPPDILGGAGQAVNDASNWVQEQTGGILGGLLGNKQLGTSYAVGGWSWVGEAGPELVRLPRGAEVVPNRRAEKMAMGGVSVTIQQANIRSEMDIYDVAYKVRDLIERQG